MVRRILIVFLALLALALAGRVVMTQDRCPAPLVERKADPAKPDVDYNLSAYWDNRATDEPKLEKEFAKAMSGEEGTFTLSVKGGSALCASFEGAAMGATLAAAREVRRSGVHVVGIYTAEDNAGTQPVVSTAKSNASITFRKPKDECPLTVGAAVGVIWVDGVAVFRDPLGEKSRDSLVASRKIADKVPPPGVGDIIKKVINGIVDFSGSINTNTKCKATIKLAFDAEHAVHADAQVIADSDSDGKLTTVNISEREVDYEPATRDYALKEGNVLEHKISASADAKALATGAIGGGECLTENFSVLIAYARTAGSPGGIKPGSSQLLSVRKMFRRRSGNP